MRILILITFALGLLSCGTTSTQSPTATQTKKADSSDTMKSRKKEVKDISIPVIKCKFDADCRAQNSCVSGTCKLTGESCRFRSDCRSMQGMCVNEKCEFP